MRHESPRLKTAVSLFTGAGGMDVGFRDAGYQIVFANDIDRDACETYRRNHSSPVFSGPLDDFFGKLPRGSDGIEMLFGGPPCQGFSVAGKMDSDDPRSELIWRFFDAVKRVRPRAFVCENVKALASLARWEKVRIGLIRKAEELGYKAKIIVLNASSYGVSQTRERMFLIGVPANLANAKFDLEKEILTQLLIEAKVPVPLNQLLHNFGPAGAPGNTRTCKAKVTYAKRPVLRPSPYAGMIFNGAGRPIRPQGYSPTLPASMGGNKTPIVDERHVFKGHFSFVEEYHKYLSGGGTPKTGDAPDFLRRLTIDECMAIQSFPKDYEFFGEQSSIYRQIGNAVPCRLAESVAKAMRRTIEKIESKR